MNIIVCVHARCDYEHNCAHGMRMKSRYDHNCECTSCVGNTGTGNCNGYVHMMDWNGNQLLSEHSCERRSQCACRELRWKPVSSWTLCEKQLQWTCV
eukprot:scaffold204678_cov24-Tisochrysis_lutea.AAC.1